MLVGQGQHFESFAAPQDPEPINGHIRYCTAAWLQVLNVTVTRPGTERVHVADRLHVFPCAVQISRENRLTTMLAGEGYHRNKPATSNGDGFLHQRPRWMTAKLWKFYVQSYVAVFCDFERTIYHPSFFPSFFSRFFNIWTVEYICSDDRLSATFLREDYRDKYTRVNVNEWRWVVSHEL